MALKSLAFNKLFIIELYVKLLFLFQRFQVHIIDHNKCELKMI